MSGDTNVVETSPNGRYVRYNSILGKGAYKTVYNAFDNDDALDVAWNKLHVDRLTVRELEKVENEIDLLRQVEHKNIIRFYDAWRGDDHNGISTINFITEKMVSGTLTSFLKKAKAIKLKVVRRWCWNILEAIAYLHDQDPPIMHRDLKCDNIFYNGHNGEVKIGDLGLSGVKARERADSVIGTPEFMAPELYEESYTEKVDIYAFGMCLLEIVTMEYPYSECSNIHQIWKKLQNGEKPQAFRKLEDGDVKQVVAVCLDHESRRPSAVDLLVHPLFRDWEQDDGIISNLSLVKSSPNSVTADHSASSWNSNGLPMGAHMIDYSDTLNRNLLVQVVEGNERSGNDEQEVSVVATNDKVGGFKVGLVIPIRDATKRVEFTFDPFIDSPQHIAQEMVAEFGLREEQISVIQEEVEIQVTKAKKQREDASRNATPQHISREANADLVDMHHAEHEIRSAHSQNPIQQQSNESHMQRRSTSARDIERSLAAQLAANSPSEGPTTHGSDLQLSQADGHHSERERSVPSSQDFTQVQVPTASMSPSSTPQSHYQVQSIPVSESYASQPVPVIHTDTHDADAHHQTIFDAHAEQTQLDHKVPQTSYNGSLAHSQQYSEAGSDVISPSAPQNITSFNSRIPQNSSRHSFPGASPSMNVPDSATIENDTHIILDQEVHHNLHSISQHVHHDENLPPTLPSHDLHRSHHVSVSDDVSYVEHDDPTRYTSTFTDNMDHRVDTASDGGYHGVMHGHFHQSISDGQLPQSNASRPFELPKRPPSTPIPLSNSELHKPEEEVASGSTLIPIKIITDDDGCNNDRDQLRSTPGPPSDQYFSSMTHPRGSSIRSQDGRITSSRPISNSMPTIVVVGNEPISSSAERHMKASELTTISLPDYSNPNIVNDMYRGIDNNEQLSRSSSRHKLFSPDHQQLNSDREQANGLPSRGRGNSQQRKSPGKSVDNSWMSSHSEYSLITQNQHRDLYGDVNDRQHYTMCLKLMDLCAKGRIEEVVAKINMGASVTFADYDKRTPIHLAASEGHASVCRLLLEHGADVNAKDRWGNTPLTDAINNTNVEVEALLRSNGARDEDTCSPDIKSLELMRFTSTGNIEGVREMLVAGALSNYQDYDKRTPLHLACSEGFSDIAELLLVNGASFSSPDRMNHSPVDDAVKNGHRDILKVLRQYGANIPRHLYNANPELENQKGMDLVEHAAKGRVDAVARHLREGASANYGDYDNRTALHLACAEGRLDVVRVLLQAGANVHARDRWGCTPIDEAIKHGYEHIIQELQSWEEKHEPHHQTSVSFDHTAVVLNGYGGSGRMTRTEPDLSELHPSPHELASSVSMNAISNMFSSDAFVAKYPASGVSFASEESSLIPSQPSTPFDKSDDGSSKILDNEERLLRNKFLAEKRRLEEEHRRAIEGLQRKKSLESTRPGLGSSVEGSAVYPSAAQNASILSIDPKPFPTEMMRNDGERGTRISSPHPTDSYPKGSQPVGNEVRHISMVQGNMLGSPLQAPVSREIPEIRHTNAVGTTDAGVQTDEEDRDRRNVVPHIERMLDGILDSVVSSDG